MKRKQWYAIAAALTCLPLAWLALEYAFAYRDEDYPDCTARTPSILLELKQVVGLQRFYSEMGQDIWVIGKVFPGVEDAYFVDIGCGDGTEASNSKALEELGWTGVAVDPFPTNWDDRKCLVLEEVVYSTQGEVVTFRKAGLLGGIDKHIDAWREEVVSQPLVEFTTTTIGDVLERANAPSFIHYMSLDVEGAEYEVLRVFPFDKYRVGALTVEHNLEEPKRQQIRDLLEANGYRFVKQQVVDDWYVYDGE